MDFPLTVSTGLCMCCFIAYIFVFYLKLSVVSETDEMEISRKNTISRDAGGRHFNGTKIGAFRETAIISRRKRNREIEVPGWGKKKSRDPAKYVKPYEDTAIIKGKEICDDPDVQLVIAVTSAPEEFPFRVVIRETWASNIPKRMRVGFLLGLAGDSEVQNATLQESLKFKDIIQDDFIDSYYNLTLKSISMLKWFIRHCPTAQFLMKVDIDTYLSLARLEYFLEGIGDNETGVLLGDTDQGHPHRNVTSKWYAPRYLYKDDVYPDYLRGKAYLMSRDVAKKLYAAALTTPIFHLEDVYITGVCAKIAGVTPKKLKRILRYCPKSSIHSIGCHPALPHVMRWLWASDVGNTGPSSAYWETISAYTDMSPPSSYSILSILRHEDGVPRSSTDHQAMQYCGMANSFMLAVIILHAA